MFIYKQGIRNVRLGWVIAVKMVLDVGPYESSSCSNNYEAQHAIEGLKWA